MVPSSDTLTMIVLDRCRAWLASTHPESGVGEQLAAEVSSLRDLPETSGEFRPVTLPHRDYGQEGAFPRDQADSSSLPVQLDGRRLQQSPLRARAQGCLADIFRNVSDAQTYVRQSKIAMCDVRCARKNR